MSDNSRDINTRDLITVNDLTYDLGSPSLVAVAKSFKPYFPDNNQYSNSSNRMILTFNSGSDFINGANSYLTFNLKVFREDGNTALAPLAEHYITFGSGSACNLINQVIVRSKDGAELENIRDVNVLAAIEAQWTKSPEYLNKMGSVQGFYNQDLNSDEHIVSGRDNKKSLTDELVRVSGKNFIIPLSSICALFRHSKLLPSMLIAGARLELVLERNCKTVFQTTADTVVNMPAVYVISNPVVMCETVALADSIQSVLTEIASTDGLHIMIETIDTTHDSTATLSIDSTVRRNISQALGLTVRVRKEVDITTAVADSMGGEAYDPSVAFQYQFRHGSQFIPTKVIDSLEEVYYQGQIAYDKARRVDSENSVSFTDWRANGKSIIAINLERNSLMDLSGVAISNSKSLQFQAKYGGGAAARNISLFLYFTRLLTVFLTNTLVED